VFVVDFLWAPGAKISCTRQYPEEFPSDPNTDGDGIPDGEDDDPNGSSEEGDGANISDQEDKQGCTTANGQPVSWLALLSG